MKPKVLLACSDNQFTPWKDHPFVGRLVTPVFPRANFSCYTAADNFAYAGWNPKKFIRMLRHQSKSARSYQWVACPDVVGDWGATRTKFNVWSEVISGFGFPLAYVLQDGQPEEGVPWNQIDCVFLGGTDAFKESSEAYDLCLRAVDREKLVHVGRVNSLRRIERFLDVMDSFDGLSYSKFRDARLPRMLKYLESVWEVRSRNALPTSPTRGIPDRSG